MKRAEWPARTALWTMFLAIIVLPSPCGPDEDDVVAVLHEVEVEGGMDGVGGDARRPIPVEVGHGLEAAELAAAHAALDAAPRALALLEGDDVLEELGGAPALLGRHAR